VSRHLHQPQRRVGPLEEGEGQREPYAGDDAPYIARTRRRRSGGAFATMATTTKTSGTTALAFTDIPSAREIAASNSRRAKRNDTAHATKNATRMSLWPPPTT